MKPLDILITSLLLFIPLLHLLIAPYTKVEESFNLQATHDVLVYGTPVADASRRIALAYDHSTFPGAVPRTFVGPVLLAGVSQPLLALLGFPHAQLIVRGVLGLFNAACLLVFRNALAAAFGAAAASWWVVLLMSQFHIAYYLTRTLPNMFAFGLTTLAAAFLLPAPQPGQPPSRRNPAIGLLVFATAIFRSELAILLATTALYLLLTSRITLRSLIPVFAVSFLASLALSVPIDSYFWQKPLWPELWGFYYNAVLGSSSNWGVSPWHYYFTSALPRLLLNPLTPPMVLLSLVNPATSRPARDLVIPNILFVAIYSFQPHKEARFIFYVVPSLTAAAALGANSIFTRRAKSLMYALASLVLCGSVLASFAASVAMLLLSSLNYPGGDALSQLYSLLPKDGSAAAVSVHADVLTCMTGLTLFGQNPAGLPLALYDTPPSVESESSAPLVLFDKTEDPTKLQWTRFWSTFDYALAEDPAKPLGNWEVIGIVEGYAGIEVLRPGYGQVDIEAGGGDGAGGQDLILGKGAAIRQVRDTVRKFTGGWWAGPRMAPQIRIMKRIKDQA
ncbi:Alg9-like mannosyltransferase family-domain-containing protein [Stachybotrys elegans]|uniref:Mannosyltransferase n=1 Tax=Stachybotrys elegans TaxID=80388 RepID=A0A8K0T076_9HYPO|nr:Alg9-like mannosyltransferase family-domain-containing protein [Stachybotrys elegans]